MGNTPNTLPPEAQKLLAPLFEQAGPIIAEVEAGRLKPEEGALQLVQTFGGFVDLLPDHAQQILAFVGRDVYQLVKGEELKAPAISPQALAAAQPLSDAERNRLVALEQIVATLNPRAAMEESTPVAPRRLVEPGEPGYDPAKDPRV